jgi:superfamily I DNA/RNA helicase/CRISPR/Cas system-associated exonuclease Cas4 (RecB family)
MPAKPSLRLTPLIPDENQRAAIEHVHGPMLVIAGAGTGKTSVLTRRIAHLIQNGHAKPSEILALTYTENAAGEMRERVRELLPGVDLAGLQACTFHAYCNNLLGPAGRSFQLLDDKDLWIYLRRQIRTLDLRYFVRAANVAQFLEELIDFIRRCHDELVSPERYAGYVERLERRELPIPRVTYSKKAVALSEAEVLERCREIARVFTTVEELLERKNLGTFAHMITRAFELLRDNAAVRREQQKRTRFLLVDEFQDANFAQVKILSQLAGDASNIFAVGDPDQAIYRFRGASSAAFGLFHKSFPQSGQVILGKNQRSTSPILQAAFAIINENAPVFGYGESGEVLYQRSPLQSAREERAVTEGTPLSSPAVDIVPIGNRDLEATDLVASIKDKQRRTRSRWKDFAVLYRSHFQRDDVADKLAQNRIPFTIENLDVMETPEVRDLLACLSITHSTRDATSLVRVAALPQFAIEAHRFRLALRARSDDASETGAGLEAMLASIDGGEKVLEAVREARRKAAARSANAAEALRIVGRAFSLDLDHPAARALIDFAAKWEEKALTETKHVGEFLEYLGDFRDAKGTIAIQSDEGDAVRLMTAHAAKGLEFNHVFILRVNSGSFPCAYRERLVEFPQDLRDPESMGEGDGKALHAAEERRLLYVAMTRARDTLTMYGRKRKDSDPTCPGALRELLTNRAVGKWLQQRAARAHQTDLFGAGEEPFPTGSLVSQWVTAPPLTLLNYLSPSAIERYGTCPLQFKLDREWKLPAEDPAALQYGSVMHSVLRTWFDAVRQGRPMTESALLDLFHETLLAAGMEDPYQHELYETQGIRQLHDFIASPAKPTVLHTEETFEMQMGDARVVGRIDRVDDLGNGRVAIVDYKTGKPKSQDEADESLQLSLYAIAARQKWGYEPEELTLYNLEGNTPVVTRRSAADLQAATAQVNEVMGDISRGMFEPTPGMHCRFCAYQRLCPATEKQLPRITPDNN